MKVISVIDVGTLSCCEADMECITDNLTAVNLGKAFVGESQARNKYEYFAKVAQKEGYRDIVEHENMYKMLLKRLQNKEEFVSEDGDEAWICEVCGHMHYGKKPQKSVLFVNTRKSIFQDLILKSSFLVFDITKNYYHSKARKRLASCLLGQTA